MTDTVAVRLLGIPIALLRRAQAHQAELLRELTLVTIGSEQNGGDAPRRLVELSAELRARYGGLSEEVERLVGAAEEAGHETVDVTIATPSSAAQASQELGAIIDEVDDWCRHGDLLTLATPPELAAFRRWYLDQFVDQIAGAPPAPWGA